MERYVPEPRRRKRKTAAFLALFLGAFGAHKFYLGNQGAGIFFFMLFVMSVNFFDFPLSALLGFLDAFKLLMLTDEEFDHKYNTKSVRTGQRYNRKRNRNRRSQEEPDFRRRQARTSKANRQTKVRTKHGTHRKENAYIKTGIKKYKEFDLDDAILDFNKGLEIDPSNVALHFNIACAYSLTEQKDKAFKHLSKAISFGLKDVKKIDSHEDLAFLRIQPEFESFKSSGYRIGNRSETSSKENVTTSKDDDLLLRLNKLAELRERGLLSEKEYHMEKQKLMG